MQTAVAASLHLERVRRLVHEPNVLAALEDAQRTLRVAEEKLRDLRDALDCE
jgi:hypothetical protein